MIKTLIPAALMSLLLCLPAKAAKSEQLDNGSVKVTIKDNDVILTFKDQDGEYRELKLENDKYRGCRLAIPVIRSKMN